MFIKSQRGFLLVNRIVSTCFFKYAMIIFFDNLSVLNWLEVDIKLKETVCIIRHW